MTGERADPGVVRWLVVVLAMIFAMVILGGITRLTGSGLSMVQWHPLMGTLPPLSESEWMAVFGRYQTSPQFRLVNHWMDLARFKEIFWWEYLHRLFGRLIGLAVFVPAVWFMVKARLRGRLAYRVAVAFFLGGSQGLLGWYMVQSGLVDRPEVNHFRLAAHLLLALLVSQWILWILLDLAAPWRNRRAEAPVGQRLATALLALVVIQIAYGAFMAGTRAGLLAPTFPDMNGHYAPGTFFFARSLWEDLVSNPMGIHYVHRALAFVLTFVIAVVSASVWRRARIDADRQLATFLGVTMVLQMCVGAATVLSHVAIPIAVAHQGLGVILLCAVTSLLHRARRTAPNTRQPR